MKGLPGQSEPLHNWRLKRICRSIIATAIPTTCATTTSRRPRCRRFPKYPAAARRSPPRWAHLSAHARADDADLVDPAGQKAKYQKAFARFASVFPDTFCVTERGRYWPDNSEDKGRLLSAGYHNTGGYYRDDTALMQLILDEKGQEELNRLWDEFDFVADQTAAHLDPVFLQPVAAKWTANKALTNPARQRPVGHEVTDTVRDRPDARQVSGQGCAPIQEQRSRRAQGDPLHFGAINATLRNLEKERAAAEPKHLAALVRLPSAPIAVR